MSAKTSRAPAETASRTDTTREKDGAAQHLEGILCTSSSTGSLEAPVTLPASSGELPGAPGRGRRAWNKSSTTHTVPLTYLQATPEPAVGLRAGTLPLKLGLYAWGVWPLEAGKGTKRVESGIYPHDVPWGEKLRTRAGL